MSSSNPFDTAVFGDGVLTLNFPEDKLPTKGTCTMAGTLETILDQNFANNNRRLDEAGQRHVSSAAFIDQQAQLGFMLTQQLVGAKAAGQLDRDSLAKSRLDAAAVGNPVVLKPA